MRPTLSLRALLCASCVFLTCGLAFATDPPSTREHIQTVPTGEQPGVTTTKSKLIPLPIYATQPNEGSTFGFMPVILQVDSQTERTESIWAPSYSWNAVIKDSGTFRWYHYPNDHQSLTITGGASTHVNYGGLLIWDNQPHDVGDTTDTVFWRWGRNVFYRFFGIGPDTHEGDESSLTRIKSDLWYRKGLNLTPYFNLGLRLELARDVVQDLGVPNLPLSTQAFAGTPGMGGSTVVSQAIDLRFDTRDQGDYSAAGSYVDLSVGPSEGLSNSPQFWTTSFEAKKLVDETDSLQGGARLFWSYVSDPNTPFYHQSSLGGSFLMRGFSEDRFFDQGAWTAEIEQRIRLFQLHIYGVTSDWRIDPFFAVGQVYDGNTGPFSHVREAGGLGFRAWVHPNVLGRVDVAVAGEGIATYVELGYPF